jgi:hypothetical protein
MGRSVAVTVLCIGLGIAGAIFATATGAISEARAGDRHAGYYYPEPATREVYEARSERLPEADRATRIGFVTGIANHISEQPFPPQAAMFAKGTEAEKLIIVALVDGRIDTIYRARAVLANMTAAARLLPAFREMGVQDWFTFLDLVHMLGFKKLTITNGRDFAHQLLIE